MRLTALLLLAATLQVSARSFGQTVSFSGKNVPLKTVFTAIRENTGYVVFYDNDLIREAEPITLHVKNMPLDAFLLTVLKGQGLTYTIVDKTITIRRLIPSAQAPPALPTPPPAELKGRVVDATNKPVAGVTILVKGTKRWTQTDADGAFAMRSIEADAILVLSAVNIEPQEVPVKGRTILILRVKTRINELDAVQLIAYGTTTRRANTGSIGHVSSEDIEKQPVTNVLQALQGRVPGLIVTQTSGYGSAAFNVQLRGQNSIAFASDPLFIIDGVPQMAGTGDTRNLGLNQNFMVSGITQSPLFSINPADIESIDVLKDADATAIYGSQGANGVILVTTKRGKPGNVKFDMNVYSGAGSVTKFTKLLNTQDYLTLRKEAYKNDGITPTVTNAPDLVKWDPNRYTDWQKMLIGNTAHTTDVQGGVSGGDEFTQYRVSGGFHRQTDVATVSGADKRSSLSASINTLSKDRKFRMGLIANYSNANTNRINFDNSLIVLPPNAPSVYDSLGRLNYTEWGTYTGSSIFSAGTNPFSVLLRPYTAVTDNLQGNLQLQYQPISHLTLRVSGSGSSIQNNQRYVNPKISQNPALSPVSNTLFGSNSVKTWIIEPQVEYYAFIGHGRLSALAGATFQNTVTEGLNGNATNFSNEALLLSLNAAQTITIYSDTHTPYRYQAFFGRLTYNWNNRYIVNVTARRDGSSRFGPGNQFGNFGALGGAWIFSEEAFVKKNLAFLSFGKLRGSYGITGSANIGDYSYLSRWTGNTYPYEGGTLSPTQHYNPDYGWEVNKKLEFASELGFLKDRIQLIASWFRNRSGNQLVAMPLPTYTGFASVITNLPALVQNSGWEISIAATPIKKKDLTWTSSFNITIARNKLLAFPNLATSSYANLYRIGKPLSMQYLLHFTGVNPQTGADTFEDVNKDGKTSVTGTSNDLVPTYDKAPAFYGGLSNNIQYKNFQLSFFFVFTKQKGYLNKFVAAIPGSISNQPTSVLSRWQKPGDVTNVAKLTTTEATNDYIFYTSYSDAGLVDASFIRLQNLSLSYTLPARWAGTYLSKYSRVFVQGQNLLTLTGYKGADPETQNLTAVPPVKFLTAGIQITF